jgi:hypothetical protein
MAANRWAVSQRAVSLVATCAVLAGAWPLAVGCASSQSGVGSPDASKGLSAEQIQQVIRGKMKVLQGCAIVGGASEGSLTVAFEVAPSGSVESAKVVDATSSTPDLEDCLVSTFERMKFPKADEPTRSEYPFNFRSK